MSSEKDKSLRKRIVALFEAQRVYVRKLWEDVSTKLWFRPSLWMIGSTLLAVGLVTADRVYLVQKIWVDAPWFLGSNPDGARTMLGSISSAMLTVCSLAFSLMMVTVVQTANAFSPRILRQFIGDTHNHHMIGILLGTFLYSLIVLRAVQNEFVPQLAVNIALLLALIATGALLSLISHVAESVKVGNIAGLILSDSQLVITEAFPSKVGEAYGVDQSPYADQDGAIVLAEESGYLQLLDGKELLDLAREANVTIEMMASVGDFILEHTPIAQVWPSERVDEELSEALHATIVMSQERTYSQDTRFGIRQLADIAVRALSPGVNDPTTATDIINSIAQILAAFVQRGEVVRSRADENGVLRVIFPEESLATLLEEAFVEIMHYGSADFATMRSLISSLGQLRYQAQEPKEQQALWDFLVRVVEVAKTNFEFSAERRTLNETLQATADVFKMDKTVSLLSTDT